MHLLMRPVAITSASFAAAVMPVLSCSIKNAAATSSYYDAQRFDCGSVTAAMAASIAVASSYSAGHHSRPAAGIAIGA